jgi:hypothetical protein
MRKRTALMLAVVTALAVVGMALATPGSVAVNTFVRATLDANKPHDGVGTAIPASCWLRFSRAR